MQSKSRIHLAYYIFVLIASALCVFLSIYFNGPVFSLDGAFQTLSALSRYANGGVPIRDFYPYLGIGMTAALEPLYWVTGKHQLLSSTFSVMTMLFFAGGFGVYFLFRSNRFGVSESIALALFVFGVTFYRGFFPGNSLRPLRGDLPLLILSLIYLINCIPRIKNGGPIISAISWGIPLILAPLWSNDFGAPTLASFVLAWILCVAPWRTAPTRSAIGTVLVAAIPALVNLAIISAFFGLKTFIVMTDGVSEYQFWFFGSWDPSRRIFSVFDLSKFVTNSLNLTVMISIIVAILASFFVRRARGFRAEGDALTLAVTLATLGGCVLPQIGGHFESGYWLATTAILPALVLTEAFKWPFLKTAFLRLVERFRSLLPARMHQPDALLGLAIVILGALPVIVFGASAALAFAAFRHQPPERAIAQSAIGIYPNHEAKTIACFKRVGDLFDRLGIATDRRMASTYLSALNLAARAQQPMQADSVIHFLGDDYRQRNISSLLAADVPIWTTINPTYAPWDRWNARASWDLFKQIGLAYEPVAETEQHMIWLRRPSPLAPQDVSASASCAVRQDSPSSVTLDVSAPGVTTPAWVEIQVKAKVEHKPSLMPAALSRYLLVVDDGPDGLQMMDDAAKHFYGIDPKNETDAIPVYLGRSTKTQIQLRVDPTNAWTLNVASCQPTVTLPAPDQEATNLPDLEDCQGFIDTLSTRLAELRH